jgi:UDP-glucose 4-epimerase
VVETVRRVTGRSVPVTHEPRRAGDPAAVWADPARARAVLNWTADRDLDAMVATAWTWHGRGADAP